MDIYIGVTSNFPEIFAQRKNDVAEWAIAPKAEAKIFYFCFDLNLIRHRFYFFHDNLTS
jgi:hypothetical protein